MTYTDEQTTLLEQVYEKALDLLRAETSTDYPTNDPWVIEAKRDLLDLVFTIDDNYLLDDPEGDA